MPAIIDHAGRINTAWRRGVSAFFEVGKLLLAAKAELDRNAFEALTRHKLHFDPSTGRKLMRIAAHPGLCAHVHKLPNNWSTAYELSKLDDEVLEAAIADGRINPKMERKDAIALRKPAKSADAVAPDNTPDASAAAREAVLDDFFAIASGGNIFARIRAAKRDKVVLTDLLDALGVAGVLEAMSAKFGVELRARVPAPKRNPTRVKRPPARPRRTLELMRTGTDETGAPLYAKTERRVFRH
jgi:hypothetical protein